MTHQIAILLMLCLTFLAETHFNDLLHICISSLYFHLNVIIILNFDVKQFPNFIDN